MPQKTYSINSPDGSAIQVVVRRDKRLKKTARWAKEADGSLLVRIPYRMRNAEIPGLLETIQGQLARRKKRAKRRTHADLQARAAHINRTYFKGRIQWEAIRWVPPMKTRLGSCTTGGPSDGHIRISEEVKTWPGWVVDYVIAHEMCHRLHPNHSPDFWQTLSDAYPLTERARGFIQGIGFSSGTTYEEADN
jgi:predicted metal-dependent hydrolase